MVNALETEPAPETRAILYRVALEALTNVRKHAEASQVEVLLERRGVGWPFGCATTAAASTCRPGCRAEAGHIGLVSMRERARRPAGASG